MARLLPSPASILPISSARSLDSLPDLVAVNQSRDKQQINQSNLTESAQKRPAPTGCYVLLLPVLHFAFTPILSLLPAVMRFGPILIGTVSEFSKS